MKDSDMIVVELSDTNEVILSDSFSNTYDAPLTDVQRGGTNDLTLLGSTGFDKNQRIVKFQRKQITNDRFDKSLRPNSKLEVIVARTSNKKMQDHQDEYWIYTVNFNQGAQGEAVEEDKSLIKIVKAHEVLNIIGWGFLADIGILAARNLRHKGFYIIIHLLCFLLTDFSSIIIGIIMLAKRKNYKNKLRNSPGFVLLNYLIKFLPE
jgi:hypothetical protein